MAFEIENQTFTFELAALAWCSMDQASHANEGKKPAQWNDFLWLVLEKYSCSHQPGGLYSTAISRSLSTLSLLPSASSHSPLYLFLFPLSPQALCVHVVWSISQTIVNHKHSSWLACVPLLLSCAGCRWMLPPSIMLISAVSLLLLKSCLMHTTQSTSLTQSFYIRFHAPCKWLTLMCVILFSSVMLNIVKYSVKYYSSMCEKVL